MQIKEIFPLPPDYDYSKCFGVKNRQPQQGCAEKCEYARACKYAADAGSSDKRLGFAHYNEYLEYSDAIGASPETEEEHSPELPKQKERMEFSRGDLVYLLEFLLRIDEYTLNLMLATIKGEVLEAAELGRLMGVSRQAIHRKLKRACDDSPELRELLIGNLYRCRRIIRGQSNWKRPASAGTGKQNQQPHSLQLQNI